MFYPKLRILQNLHLDKEHRFLSKLVVQQLSQKHLIINR